jgi:hypothetical protein
MITVSQKPWSSFCATAIPVQKVLRKVFEYRIDYKYTYRRLILEEKIGFKVCFDV